jgi:DNA-binding NarL/FixJ family response regulator
MGRPRARATQKRHRVVVGESDPAFREGLVAVLGGLGNVEVVALAATGADVVIEAFRHHPDVVLLDLRLPGLPSAEVVRHIARAAPGTVVCLLVGTEFDQGISEALDAGARDCLKRTAAPEEITVMLRRTGAQRATRDA